MPAKAGSTRPVELSLLGLAALARTTDPRCRACAGLPVVGHPRASVVASGPWPCDSLSGCLVYSREEPAGVISCRHSHDASCLAGEGQTSRGTGRAALPTRLFVTRRGGCKYRTERCPRVRRPGVEGGLQNGLASQLQWPHLLEHGSPWSLPHCPPGLVRGHAALCHLDTARADNPAAFARLTP